MSCFSRLEGYGFDDADIAAAVRAKRLLSIELEPTLRCNFRCQYCYAQETEHHTPAALSLAMATSVVDQAVDLGARKVVLLGGEPMIYPEIMALLGHIAARGARAEVFTNGTAVSPARARALADLGVSMVVKLNTFDPELQGRLAGVDSAHRIITDALAALTAAGYPGDGLHLGVSSIICAENVDELPAIWHWARQRGIDPYFETITPQGLACDNAQLDVDIPRTRVLFEAIAEIDRRDYGRHWKPQPPLVGNRCLRHRYSCLVSANGDVRPCVGVTLTVGNVHEQPLAEIIAESEVLDDLRHLDRRVVGPCATCTEVADCFGCRGAAYQLTGDYLASDPTCWHGPGAAAIVPRLPMPAVDLVPHDRPMLLIDELVEVAERAAVVRARPRPDCCFAGADGRLDDAAFVELIAQSMAALEGYRNRGLPPTGTPPGLLVGIRHLSIVGSAAVGDELTVTVHKDVKIGDFGSVSGRVEAADGRLLAEGSLRVWQPAVEAPARPLAAALRVLLLLVLALTGLRAAADDATALTAIEDRLRTQFANVETIGLNFVEEKRMALFDDTITLRGSLFLHRSGRLAWRVTEPVRYALIVSADAIQQWDEDSDKVMVIPLKDKPALRAMVDQLRQWFTGRYEELRQDYAIELLGEDPIRLRFTPKPASAAGAFIARVRVEVDPKSLYAREIVIEERGGDSVTMHLQEVTLNAPETPATWQVKPDE